MSQTYEDRPTLAAFNALAAGAADKLGRMELIKTVPDPTSENTITVDFSDIDWNEWEYVIVERQLQYISSGGNITAALKKSDNSNISSTCAVDSNALAYFNRGPFMIVFMPRHSADNQIMAICLGTPATVGVANTTFAQLGKMQMHNCAGTWSYISGTRIYGVR